MMTPSTAASSCPSGARTTTTYQLEPEVPGALAADAELDTSTHPPVVRRLVVEFDDWLEREG